MVTGGAVCLNWACTESVRGEVSDGLPYLDPWQEVCFFSCRSCRSGRPALDALFHSWNPFQHRP